MNRRDTRAAHMREQEEATGQMIHHKDSRTDKVDGTPGQFR